jgi:hypothetical protein
VQQTDDRRNHDRADRQHDPEPRQADAGPHHLRTGQVAARRYQVGSCRLGNDQGDDRGDDAADERAGHRGHDTQRQHDDGLGRSRDIRIERMAYRGCLRHR